MESSSTSHNENDQNIVWDDEYGCFRINGVLFPQPINEYCPWEAAATLPPTATAKRSPQFNTVDTKTYLFQLSHCEEINKFILMMNEVDTEDKTSYVLTPTEDNGKKKMLAKETRLGESWVLSPVVGEIYPNDLADQSNHPIEYRFTGKWDVDLRVRLSTMKMERVYRLEGVRKIFRSMNEVATFIAYNMY